MLEWEYHYLFLLMINEPGHWPSTAFNLTKVETIRCVFYGSTIYEVFLLIKPESDQAFRSNYQFRNKEVQKNVTLYHRDAVSNHQTDGNSIGQMILFLQQIDCKLGWGKGDR